MKVKIITLIRYKFLHTKDNITLNSYILKNTNYPLNQSFYLLNFQVFIFMVLTSMCVNSLLSLQGESGGTLIIL